MKKHTPYQRVTLARDAARPGSNEYIDVLFEDFFETRGDRAFGDDGAILCGIASFRGIPVTVAAHRKGKTIEDRARYNFGMASPEGYRKFQRALQQAVKFKRPVITFIDTPGAFPGKTAEERGQGEAIARCLFELSAAPVPIICVIIGEGGSGGALALGLADKIIMLENAVYSVLSPEGFASILWKDASRAAEASELMKLTAADLHEFKIADAVIDEPEGASAPMYVIGRTGDRVHQELSVLMQMSPAQLLRHRYQKYRNI